MKMQTIKRLFTLKLIFTIIFSISVIIISKTSLSAWTGIVIDKETGKPVQGAVIVRSWDRTWGTLAGETHSPLTFEETTSDKNGKFKIFSIKRYLHIIIPLLTYIEENKPLVFKPGYKFLVVNKKSSVLKLDRIPATYYLRYEEAQKARDNYQINFQRTKLLKKMIETEEDRVKSLPRYVHGVFYQRFRFEEDFLYWPCDIEIDEENNVFIADDGYKRTICKISKKGKLIKKSRRRSSGSIEIEFDKEGNLYSLENKALAKVNTINLSRTRIISGKKMDNHLRPMKDIRFTIGENKKLFLITKSFSYIDHQAVYKSFLFTYDFAGNLLCKCEMSNKNSGPNIQLIDIGSTTDDNIIIGYSYFRSFWDKKQSRYVARNGILKFGQNCNQIFDKTIDIDKKIKTITTTAAGLVIVADKSSFYVFDKNINLIFKENLTGKELGEVDIERIKSDKSGNWLYIIEGEYRRILKYNLKKRELYLKKINLINH